MNKAVLSSAFLLPAMLILAACNGGTGAPDGGKAEQGNLEGAAIGGPFTLTGEDGKPVNWSDFDGKYRIVYFGYTYCPDVCPLDLSKIMAGFKLLEKSDPEKAARIQPIFITVDPERDDAEAVRTYTAAFHPRLLGITGTPGQIEAVEKEFAVVASKEGDQAATKDYLVSHSRTPYLFGPDGKPIALVPFDDTTTPEDEASPEIIRDFLETWVK